MLTHMHVVPPPLPPRRRERKEFEALFIAQSRQPPDAPQVCSSCTQKSLRNYKFRFCISYFLVISVHLHYHLGCRLNTNFPKSLTMAN